MPSLRALRDGDAFPAPVDDPDKLPSKERLDSYRGNREKKREMEEAGELVEASVFEALVWSSLKLMAVTLESPPDVLEGATGIDGAAVTRAQAVIDRVWEALYRKFCELTPEVPAKVP